MAHNELAYQDIHDAPASHRDVARYIALWGKSYAEISKLVKLTTHHISRIATYQVVADEIIRIKIDQKTELALSLDNFAALLPKAVMAIDSVLDVDSGASNKDKLAAAQMVLDREPSARFIKTTRHERKDIKVVDSRRVEEIKQLSHNLGRPQAIEIDFEVVEKPEEILNWQDVIETIGGF